MYIHSRRCHSISLCLQGFMENSPIYFSTRITENIYSLIMHELHLASNILEVVSPKLPSPETPFTVHITVGGLSGVHSESRECGFRELSKSRGYTGASIQTHPVHAQAVCTRCSCKYECPTFENPCPKCGDYHKNIISGQEFTLDYLELED